MLVAAPLLLPEHRDADAGRLDLASVVLSLATILPVIYGLKELAHAGWAQVPLAAVGAGVCFGVGFVRRQVRLDEPLLDISLFRTGQFSSSLGMNLDGGVVMAGSTQAPPRSSSPLEGPAVAPRNLDPVASNGIRDLSARHT